MSKDKTEFKVGDRVRYIEDGDEGLVTNINSMGWITVEFEKDGDCNMLAVDLERVTPGEKTFVETVSDFSSAVSHEDIESIARLGDVLGIYPSSFEGNVRRILDGVGDTIVAKNLSYGDSALNPIRVFSKADRTEQLYTRLDDKLSRVQRGHEYPGDDTIRDIIGYCTLILIARESA